MKKFYQWKRWGIYIFLLFILLLPQKAMAAGKTYRIVYKINVGVNHEKNPAVYTSDQSIKLYSPTRTGYKFGGWYLDKKYTQRIKKIKKGTKGKLKLYAKWNVRSYKIVYKLNKGTNNENNPLTYQYNKAAKLYQPVRENYSFQGWYTDKALTTKIKKIPKHSVGKIHLYAKWGPPVYQITYTLNGGSNHEANPDTYSYETEVVLQNPVRDFFSFQGWYTESTFENRVDRIPAGSMGDITLYAKWYLAALNENGMGTSDMIWSWWYYPQVVSYGEDTKASFQKLFWGYNTSQGYSGVAEYDRSTGEVKKTALKKATVTDDHNGLALAIRGDGRILCAYAGGHNKDNEIHIRISNEPYSIERFDTEIVKESSGSTCYSQILQYQNKFFVFYRVNNKNWAYISSEDGLTWSDETILITASIQYYCKFVPTTQDGLLRVCMYSNPDTTDTNIRMGFFDMERGMLLNSDGITELGTKKVSQKKFDIVIGAPENQTQRMFDVAVTEPEHPEILFAVFELNQESLDSLYYLYDAGVVNEICHGGNPLWNPKYQLGASFLGRERIVLARNENGFDEIEIFRYDSEKVFLDQFIYSEVVGESFIRNARPIVDIHGKAFLWHRGWYNQNSYKKYLTDAELYFLE